MKRLLPLLLLLAVMAVAAVLAAGVLLPRPARPPRTVVLRMADYLFNGSNPTLAFRPGERVRFVVRNDEDTQVKHNFGIPGLGIRCGRELEPGESLVVEVTLPRSGEFAYTCCTHAGMGGRLVIRER